MCYARSLPLVKSIQLCPFPMVLGYSSSSSRHMSTTASAAIRFIPDSSMDSPFITYHKPVCQMLNNLHRFLQPTSEPGKT